MKRTVVHIDEEKCDGCGLCIPNCHEGALQMIDGKARLVSDLMCDGLGACIGYCPQGAISMEEREAAPYDEKTVMKDMISKGRNVVKAHLQHLSDHGEKAYMEEGIAVLKESGPAVGFDVEELLAEMGGGTPVHRRHSAVPHAHAHRHVHACPGSIPVELQPAQHNERIGANRTVPSQLGGWPVQMHLINPAASQFRGTDLVLSADCVAYAMGDFHNTFLRGKTLAIACPKLDARKESYLEKLKVLIEEAAINTLTVIMMEVPCCGGLLDMARMAVNNSSRKVPLKAVTVSIRGEILKEHWI